MSFKYLKFHLDLAQNEITSFDTIIVWMRNFQCKLHIIQINVRVLLYIDHFIFFEQNNWYLFALSKEKNVNTSYSSMLLWCRTKTIYKIINNIEMTFWECQINLPLFRQHKRKPHSNGNTSLIQTRTITVSIQLYLTSIEINLATFKWEHSFKKQLNISKQLIFRIK